MTSRTTARLVAGAAALGGLLCTAVPAHAALTAPVADAFVVSSSGLVTVAPLPHSNYPGPPTGTITAVNITAAPFASNGTLTASTSGDPTAGTSSAEAKADDLTVTLGSGVSLVLGAIDTKCNATQSSASGTSSIANAHFTVAGVSTGAITIPNANATIALPLSLGSLEFFPSSTDSNGVLTEDAIKITLGAGNLTQTLTIAQAQCGGAPPVVVNPTPMISTPMAAGAGATAIIGGVVYLRRRKSGKDTVSSI
jgi:hypothetical protein